MSNILNEMHQTFTNVHNSLLKSTRHLLNRGFTNHDNYLVKYNDNTTQNLSLNFSRDESKIHSISINELNEFIVDNKMENIRVLDAGYKNQIKFKNEMREYWKFCLILTLLFFLFEILFIRRIENEYTY